MKKSVALLIAIAVVLGIAGAISVSAGTAWDACSLTGAASVVKGDLNSTDLWESGGISATGAEYKEVRYARTKGYVSREVALVYAENDYVFRVAVYDSADRFLGFWDNREIAATSKALYYLKPKGLEGYKIRLLCQRFDAETIALSECSNIHFLNDTDAEQFSPQPTLTFIDDDGSLDALKNWESICDELGIQITSALVTNAMGDENDPNRTKASWSDVARLQEKGFEFVSHTHNHINLIKNSEKTCEADLQASVAALREHGCEYRYLVYPYNAIDTDKVPLVEKYFEAGVGLGGTNANPGSDNVLPVYTYWLRRYSINEAEATTKVAYGDQMVDAHAFKSADTLKSYIDDAVANGSWVIIMTHLRNDGIFYHDEESRQMIVDLCEYAREKGVAIQSFGEAFSRYKNVTETGNKSIYGNPHYIVDCNGVVHYRGQNGAGHIEQTVPAKAPTCAESGLTQGVCCAACDAVLLPRKEIPATGEHIYDNDRDAVCNACYAVRRMVDSFSFRNYRITLSDSDSTHINHRVVVYSLGDQTVADPSDETLLKSVDSTPVTHWDIKNINRVLLTDAGNYVVLLKYNVETGAVVKVPLRVRVSSAPKLFWENNEISVLDSYEANINHRLVVYYLGDQTVADVYDEAALRALDAAPVTYWGLPRINKLILTKPGNYALLLNYNEGKSAKKTVAQLVQAAALTEPVIEGIGADYALNVGDADATHKYHRATVYYLGDQTVADVYDEAALRAIDGDARTHWGLRDINKVQLIEKGNYAVVLHYNLSNGTKRTVASLITVDLEKPVLNVQNGNLELTVPAEQYVNYRATVYYLGGENTADIYDEAALRVLDPDAKTRWGIFDIERTELTTPGNYVILLHYNLPGSAKLTVAAQVTV